MSINGINGLSWYYQNQGGVSVNENEEIENLYGNTEADSIADVEAAEAEFAQAAESVGKTESTQATQSTSNLTSEEVEDLKDELDANKQRMEAVKEEIEKLSEEAAEIIADAVASQEAAVAEAKEESQKAIDEQLQAYIKANQEGGEGMTRDELKTNIAGALPDSPSLTKTLGQILDANEMLSDIDGLLGELKCLLTTSADLAEQIDGAGEAAQEGKKCCDPIGFVSNNVEYNFFTDKDGDGKLSQTNEFLGADNQWAEMQAADADGNGTVTAEELETAGIQLAGTDGSIISGAEAFTEAFGENFSIDLNSYAEGGSHSAVDTTADFDADGVMDQQLLGTFNVNVNGSDVQGYNTLDDVDWLSSNYGVAISGETADVENATSGLLDTSNLGEFQAMGEFYNTALEKNQMMRQQLEGVEEAIGFDTESVDAYKELLASQAEVKAKDFVDSVEITPRVRETAKSVGTGSNGTANIDGSYTLNGVQYNTIMDGSELENLASQIQSGGNGNQWGYPDACLSFAYAYGAWIDGTSNSEMNGASSSSYQDAGQYSEFNGSKEEVLAEIKNQLDSGKPVVLRVNGNLDGTSRHYVTVVGYSSSAGDTLTEDDLIILDTYDGQIEGMGSNGARFMILGTATDAIKDAYQIYTKN